MESKPCLFLACIIAALLVSSVSIEMKADLCMKKQMPFAIACDIGSITQGVSFYNNEEKAVSCVPPEQQYDRMAVRCSLSKDNSTALLEINAVDSKKDSGDWYCVHGTEISSKFKMECSQCGICEAFAVVTTVISCILVICDSIMVILHIIRCYRKWFCFIMEMASAIMGSVGAIGLPMLCEMDEDEEMMHFGMALDISSTVLGLGLMIYEFAKSQCCQELNRVQAQQVNMKTNQKPKQQKV